ncbi:MAG: RtcB family protein [Acidobacteria bacterium]|nr:RtcB family protein [Acidobacteriota bacterium]
MSDNPAFAAAAHGAGRMMSPKMAKLHASEGQVRQQFEAKGISVRPGSVGLLSEEARMPTRTSTYLREPVSPQEWRDCDLSVW